MKFQVAPGPVSLSYVAALRGIKSRAPGEPFAYADLNCTQPDFLICLAASNPEGQFYGMVGDEAICLKAQQEAQIRGVSNVNFMSGTPSGVLAQLAKNSNTLPLLHYMSCDDSHKPLSAVERQAAFDLASKQLLPGGLFNYTYRAYTAADGHLRFLVREAAPEMNVDQAKIFLDEIKKLGGTYLKSHSDVAAKLEEAITNGIPDEFFNDYEGGEARSGAFDTIVALRPRGFVYVGDSSIASNYVDLVAPVEAQDVIMKCTQSPLYEVIKDFALNRTVRSDIWCRHPVTQTANMSELFGGFTYGIIVPREDVPEEVKAQGKTVQLKSPVFKALIDLLTLMPASIGDFLLHPTGKNFKPAEIVGAIQILIACGLAQPMRGLYAAENISNVEKPRLAGGFNQHVDKTPVNGNEVWMSSPVLGAAISVSARDVLVMQALNRVGLANSVSALLPELERLAQNPAQAVRVMDVMQPTAETAHSMIDDVVTKSIVQWYAYGLLEAA